MIHVISGDNQHLYGPQLDEMFRLRHEYFIENHGWDALKGNNGLETDEFDDGEVIYLVNLDANGQVISAFRLNPSIGPNLLTDKLSSYVDGTPPQNPQTWDLSRWIISKKYRRSANYDAAVQHTRKAFIALEEFCLSRNITRITTISETPQIERLARVDIHFKRLGPPIEYENGKGIAQALILDVSPEALGRTRAATGIMERQLFEVKPRPIYANHEDMANAAQAELANAQAKLAGKTSTRAIVKNLTEEMVRRVDKDPAGAIALIHAFNEELTERLTIAGAHAYSIANKSTNPIAHNEELPKTG